MADHLQLSCTGCAKSQPGASSGSTAVTLSDVAVPIWASFGADIVKMGEEAPQSLTEMEKDWDELLPLAIGSSRQHSKG